MNAKLKKRIQKIPKRIISRIAYCCLCVVNRITSNDDRLLKVLLYKNGYSFEICYNPTILFRGNKKSVNMSFIRRLLLGFLINTFADCVKHGAMRSGSDKIRLLDKGVTPDFAEDLGLVLKDIGDSIVFYNIPNLCKITEKIAVYTVITGDYDSVHDPLYVSEDIDYYLFTNNRNISSKVWTVVFVDSELSDLMLSRDVRMHPLKYLPHYNHSIYVDASILIYGDMSKLTRYLDDDTVFVATRHCARQSIKEEMIAFSDRFHLDFSIGESQYKRYLNWGFTDDMGLSENGMLIMRHSSKELQKVMNDWYLEFQNEPIKSDQVSLMPCMFRNNFTHYKLVDGSVWRNQFFRVLRHK